MKRSRLSDIPGVGPKRVKDLLAHFHSIDAIQLASIDVLCKAPGVFKAAVAGAPVTDWEGYDTMYSERYMGLPASNREGYAASSVMHHCANLTRQQRLLIVHGLLDENVHARHTFRLVNHANELGLSGSIELLLFPDERHMMKGLEARLKLETELTRFLEAELAADPAPADDDEPMAE